ncbi:hypothetical protein, partial [Klebsiella pneumoniae]|uniref:hypothetical protein n=1 Tax=Klebsiella pneumoniae TaxID=573 RepID=UPI0025A23D66
LLWLGRSQGWLPEGGPWFYAVAVILIVATVLTPMRISAALDDQRISSTLQRRKREAKAAST